MGLGVSLFRSFRDKQASIKIPLYDKSLHNGKGDRVPQNEWRLVNADGDKKVEVIIFEGWCVGFRPLSNDEATEKWREAVDNDRKANGRTHGRLGKQRLEDVVFINDALRQYDEMTE